jgi:hypothetical protein
VHGRAPVLTVWQLRREAADVMLKKNGDFLVRENVQAPGQYVLSTMQAVR